MCRIGNVIQTSLHCFKTLIMTKNSKTTNNSFFTYTSKVSTTGIILYKNSIHKDDYKTAFCTLVVFKPRSINIISIFIYFGYYI